MKTLTESKILIVDDRPENVRQLELVLKNEGYTSLRCITDSREVVQAWSDLKPDLLLLDLQMPYVDGFQIMEQLKGEVQEDEWLPILVLTADITPETKRKALASGAKDFLSKPLDHVEVLLRIRNLLETGSLQDQLKQQNEQLEAKVRERTRELRKSLEDLQAAQVILVEQERLRALGEMASGIAHDFNNALSPILGYTELLLSMPHFRQDDQKLESWLQTMNTAAQDASHIINRMREFYR